MAVETSLLFVACQTFESGKAFRGASLLTDTDTKPVDFRCTDAIRPTSLQTVLYGQMLHQHIVVELVAVQLLKALKQPPTVVLVQEPALLWLRTKIASPVLLLGKESSDSDGSGGNSTKLSSTSGRFEPVVLFAHKEFGNDLATLAPILAVVFNRLDLLEPFKRVVTALEQVHQQKIGEPK
jgi:hypothetical protein